MSVLHVDLVPKKGAESALEQTYHDTFGPAIRQQAGFRSVALLRPAESGSWRLGIEFEREDQRVAWTETALHQEVWGAMESQLDSYEPVLFQEVNAP